MTQRRKARKRADFNLLGKYLQRLYGELGITSDKEIAEKAGLHQTTLSNDKRGKRRATTQTLEKLITVLRTYPGWQESYTRELFIAADRAIPEERQALEERLQNSSR